MLTILIALAFASVGFLLVAEYSLVVQFLYILILLALVGVLSASLLTWRQGYRPALYLFVAELAPFIFGILAILARLGLYGGEAVAIGLPVLGNIFLISFLSLALADRINVLQRETAQSSQALPRE